MISKKIIPILSPYEQTQLYLNRFTKAPEARPGTLSVALKGLFSALEKRGEVPNETLEKFLLNIRESESQKGGINDIATQVLGSITCATIIFFPLGYRWIRWHDSQIAKSRYAEFNFLRRSIETPFSSFTFYIDYRRFVLDNRERYAAYRGFSDTDPKTHTHYVEQLPGILAIAQSQLSPKKGPLYLFEEAVSRQENTSCTAEPAFIRSFMSYQFKIPELVLNDFPIAVIHSLPIGLEGGLFDINSRIEGFSLLHIIAMMKENKVTTWALQALLLEGADPTLRVEDPGKDQMESLHPLKDTSVINPLLVSKSSTNQLGTFTITSAGRSKTEDLSTLSADEIAEHFGRSHHAKLLREFKDFHIHFKGGL